MHEPLLALLVHQLTLYPAKEEGDRHVVELHSPRVALKIYWELVGLHLHSNFRYPVPAVEVIEKHQQYEKLRDLSTTPLYVAAKKLDLPRIPVAMV